ncbi:MAG TPA: HNH endonuclease signature motif containing protein [Nocardioidaceae bacterium]|nr:HNH endonuclease signature motif containing protein [Nocardioidaceae bacterium]
MTGGTTIEDDTASVVLSSLRWVRQDELSVQAEKLALAVSYAAMNSSDSIVDAACFGDSPVPVAGPGAPLVAEFAVAEFAAALGLPTETGKYYLGEAVELAHRLPKLYGRVQRLELVEWRARRIARATIGLSMEAAAFVDRHIAAVAHKVGLAVLDRLIDEAKARFMPEEAEADQRDAMDGRHFGVDHRQVSMTGTSRVYGELDLADALDLDAAVAAGAEQRKRLGDEDCLNVRRAAALGDLARAQLSLDLEADDAPAPARKPVVLTLHISRHSAVGRVENTRTPITVEQIRAWCANPFADIVVKPVIDLNDHIHVGQYEVPDRLANQVDHRDQTCVFPWCQRPATRCDHDHVVSFANGGATCSCNIAPKCRRHHRLKTHHGGWTYTVVEPGVYLWTSPHGYQFLRDHTGTQDVSRDRCRPPPDG